MEQDLFDWLNSHANTQGKGLLIAPLSSEKRDDIPAPQENIISEHEEYPADDSENDNTSQQEEFSVPEEYVPQYTDETAQENLPDDSHDEQQDFHDESDEYVPQYTGDTSQVEADEYVPQYADEPVPDEVSTDDDVLHDHEWQERATGFTLSLDEPPPELWTHINDDDPEPDYEPTDSLQGAAYVQIHGRNFTERLHHTLKHRKERAEERLHSEQETDPSAPLKQMAVILCGTLIIALGFALLSLWFVWRETPDGMKRRAESLSESGKFEEAAEIYRKAYRRYPSIPEFLERLSDTSQKAGHVQTAKAAHDEYIKLTTSPDVPAKPDVPNTPAPETPPYFPHISLILNEKPLTFDECMNEANHAYNIGMYTRALEYFSRAMKLNSRDFRPYIGMSASYRMKGWYVDSMHIIEEARRKFGRSPALDMETYFLREAK